MSYEMAFGGAGGNAKMSHLASAAQRSMRKRKDKGPKASSRGGQWEFDRNNLTDMKEIGSGNFGKVFLGKARGLIKGKDITPVAIKTLTSTGKEAESEFLSEVAIMQQIDGPHHIVRLLGVCTDKSPMYMIMEFMARGDLKEVLRHARPKKNESSELTPAMLTKMCSDVAEGMAYLAKVHIVHRDLAARNCLVAEDYSVKVGDFGLTRDVYHVEYYRMSGAASLPIRWMSPESLNDGVFSTASDVWSFGVTMWEVVTFGKTPYPGLENAEVVDKVCDDDYRMAQPENCPGPFYAIMRNCWEEEPEDRPMFQDLYQELAALAGKLSKKPVVHADAVKDDKAAGQATYATPQDAIIFDGEDSAEEEEYTPYGLTGVDMESYGLVGAKGRGLSSSAAASAGDYDLATPSRKTEPEEEPSYDLATPRSGSTSSPTGEKPYVRRGTTAAVAAEEAVEWVESVLGIKKPAGTSISEWLKSGEELCALMNKLRPGTIPKYSTGSKNKRAFQQMENISKFLDACAKLGLKANDRFETIDLHEDSNTTAVINCLIALRVATSS